MAVYGVYRGICVDNRDPLAQGRVRVVVPQIMGSAASGWAFPSWGMDDLTTWPEDRLPKPGQGVWILFEGADRLTWISAFGPQEFSEQHKDNNPDYYGTAIDMEVSVLPTGVPVPVVGTLSSPAGVPFPGALVRFEKAPANQPSDFTGQPIIPEAAWIPVGIGEVAADGAWSIDYTRPADEIDWWYRASYTGIEPYISSSSEPQQVPIPNDTSAISWNDPEPEWMVPCAIEGLLVAGSDGVGVPEEPVHLYIKVGTGPWTRAATTETAFSGEWSMTWTRTKAMVDEILMRVVYLGSINWDYSQDPTPYKTLEKIQVPVVLDIVPPKAVEVSAPATFTGTISSQYGLPEPTPTIVFQVRHPSAQISDLGVWVDASTVAVLSDGSWSATYTSTRATGDYRAYFPGTGVYLPQYSEEVSFVTYQETVTSVPDVPKVLYYGTPFTLNGTVEDLKGNPVPGGAVVLEMRLASGANQEWGPVYGMEEETPVSTSGVYRITHPDPTFVGPVRYRVQYLDNPYNGYQPSTSPELATSIGLKTPIVTKGALTHSSASISWAAVPGATVYRAHYQTSGASYWVFFETSALTYTFSNLSASTDYNFKVSALRLDATGKYVEVDSATIKCNTGTAAVGGKGSFQKEWPPAATNSWRPTSPGWMLGTSFGDQVIQGRFGSSGSYQGIITYDGASFRNWVVQTYGQSVLNNMSFEETSFWMQRADAGGYPDNRAVKPLFYVTSAVAGQGSGPFSYAGGEWGQNGYVYNEAKWTTLQNRWWSRHILMNEYIQGTGVCSSFVLMHDSLENYARFVGASGHVWALRVTCTWDYTTAADVPAKWY